MSLTATATAATRSALSSLRSLLAKWPWSRSQPHRPDEAPDPDDEFELSIAPQRTERRSYEWIPFGAKDPLCWAPWRVLKVDIFGRTQNCCGFFEKLPEFDWPSARDFHSETGMWNNPLLQNMRTTMGTPDELPFCTFCKVDDKRHPDSAPAKREASIRSGAVFQQIYDQTAPFKLGGNIDNVPGDLPSWAAPTRLYPNVFLRPFRNGKLHYRRLVRTRGFWGAGDVLVLGVLSGAIPPFLAEANKTITLADLSKGRLRNSVDVLQALGFDNAATAVVSDPSALPWEADSFDGAWLDGLWLTRFGRILILRELRRVMRPGAQVYVSGAAGLGDLVRRALAAETEEERCASIDTIAKGPTYAGVGGFMSADTLVAALKGTGFSLDRARPALSRYEGRTEFGREDWTNHRQVAERLRDEDYRASLKAEPERLRGMVERVSFTAIAQ